MNIYIQLILFILATSVLTGQVQAKTKIIEIKRTLSLKNNKQHYKEFYIDAGKNKGLKVKQVIPVVRKRSFYDPLLNKNAGDLWLPIGDIKLIHVGNEVSVARIYKVPGRKHLAEVEYPTFMMGDEIITKKARFISTKKKKTKTARRKKYKKAKRGIASLANKKKAIHTKENDQYSFSDQLRDQMAKPTTGGSSNSRYVLKNSN